MGGVMGKIGSTMGKVGSSIGNVFTGNGDEIGDSGFSVGDMKDLGYDKGQIAGMGATNPSGGTKFARAMIKGTMQGAGQGMQQNQKPQQGGGAAAIIPSAPPQVQTQDPNYLAQYLQKKPVDPNAYFYGG